MRGCGLVYGDKVWGVATLQPEPMEKKSGLGFRAGGDKPQFREGKLTLGGFRNIEEEIEFPIRWWFKLRKLWSEKDRGLRDRGQGGT